MIENDDPRLYEAILQTCVMLEKILRGFLGNVSEWKLSSQKNGEEDLLTKLFYIKIPQEVIDMVERQIEEEHKNYPKGMGYCHMFWARKKQILKMYGYDCKTPTEENPYVIYD